MKRSNIWLNRTLLILLLFCNCKKKDNKVEADLMVKVDSFKIIDSFNAYAILSFNNKTNTNYILPGLDFIYLTHTKGMFINYDDVGKIQGKIVSSDFQNIVIKMSDESIKIQHMISNYTEFRKKNISLCDLDDPTFFSHQILFVPKNREVKLTVWFNANEINYQTLLDKNSKIILPHLYDIFNKYEYKYLDSLNAKSKLNYQVYINNLFVEDSLKVHR